jgi:cystathionine beta-synthase
VSRLLEERSDPGLGAQMLESINAAIKATGGVQVEGAGKNALTDIMKMGGKALSFVDSAVRVNDFDAFDECRATAAAGVLVGGSAGLNICAAKVVADRCAAAQQGATIVTLLCDHGIKYLSKVFNDEWMAKHDTRESSQN